MAVVSLVGRLLVAWLFIASGFGNVVRAGRVAAHLRARGLSRPRRVSQFSGVLMIGLGAAIGVGLWLDAALALSAALLATIAVVVYPFWSAAGTDRERMNVEFWKNVALAGALVAWLASIVDGGDVPFGVTGPLF